jgi:hypothetical protein
MDVSLRAGREVGFIPLAPAACVVGIRIERLQRVHEPQHGLRMSGKREKEERECDGEKTRVHENAPKCVTRGTPPMLYLAGVIFIVRIS